MSVGIIGLIAAATAFVVANIIKVSIRLIKKEKYDHDLMASGGMPSAHTTTVAALTIALGLGEGFNSTIFALAIVFLIIVAYDATHVRRAVGEQGKALRKVLSNGTVEPYNCAGHSVLEVAIGCLLGLVIGTTVFFILSML